MFHYLNSRLPHFNVGALKQWTKFLKNTLQVLNENNFMCVCVLKQPAQFILQ